MKLADAIALADIRDMVPYSRSRGGYHGGNSHPIPQPYLISKKITQGKHFYQNTCWCAGGKCDRCKARECTDRDWRKKGREVP
jgi:hypothetical protein